MTGRSSTRIHAPPGGSSQAGSLIFGGGNPSTEDRFAPAQQNTYASTQHTSGQQQQQQQQQQSSSSSSFSNKEQFNYQNNVQTTQQPVAKKATQSRGISGNAYANGTNQNCGNYITDRPTSRVLAPPGGKSSGPLW